MSKKRKESAELRTELVLVHENIMGIRLLPEEDKEIFARKCHHLVQQRLNNGIP